MADLFICPDCELPLATALDSLCVDCQKWRSNKFAEMDDEYKLQQERRMRRRMTPGQRFGEALADMVKATERSKQ